MRTEALDCSANADFTGAATSTDSAGRGKILLYFALFYLWILTTTPQVRFKMLGEIHFERVVMVVMWLLVLLSGKFRFRLTFLTVAFVAFSGWLFICFFASPYHSTLLAEQWLDRFWKVLVFYAFCKIAIQDGHDVRFIMIGYALILLSYQIHSWRDFLIGGSYVYQQGMKRMIAVWGGGGIGAANGWAVINLFSFPCSVFWYKTSRKRVTRFLAFLNICLAMASILFSGTRGAFVVLVLMGILYVIGSNMKAFKKVLLMVVLPTMILVGAQFFPEALRHRYIDLIFFSFNSEVEQSNSVADQIAVTSAQGRIQGLIDGWRLALQHPATGVGPGASAEANYDGSDSSQVRFQLHNLYGQVLAETGFVGAVLFVTAWFAFFRSMRRCSMTVGEAERKEAVWIPKTLRISGLGILFYGMFAHLLYAYQIPLFFALADALYLTAKEQMQQDAAIPYIQPAG